MNTKLTSQVSSTPLAILLTEVEGNSGKSYRSVSGVETIHILKLGSFVVATPKTFTLDSSYLLKGLGSSGETATLTFNDGVNEYGLPYVLLEANKEITVESDANIANLDLHLTPVVLTT